MFVKFRTHIIVEALITVTAIKTKKKKEKRPKKKKKREKNFWSRTRDSKLTRETSKLVRYSINKG